MYQLKNASASMGSNEKLSSLGEMAIILKPRCRTATLAYRRRFLPELRLSMTAAQQGKPQPRVGYATSLIKEGEMLFCCHSAVICRQGTRRLLIALYIS